MIAPSNTTEEVRRNPEGFLGEAMVRGTSGAIEAQEARGQRELVGSDTLPTEMRAEDRAALESIGFKFIGPVEGDSLFQYVQMAPGWKKKATDHSMHIDLVDEKGRKRSGIFYKAAFYDRSAHLYPLNTRFSVGKDYGASLDQNILIMQVRDGDKVIFRTDPLKTDGGLDYTVRRDLERIATEKAEAWLAERYPDYKNPLAYWD